MSFATDTTIVNGGECEKFNLLPHELIQAYILPRLDGCTLTTLGCTTPTLHTQITSDQTLWSHLCHSTWPSTKTPHMGQVISTFQGGPHKFYSLSFPPLPPTLFPLPSSTPLPGGLISAVDLFYREKCIFSKIKETETDSGWFYCSPFRIDILDPKESIPTPIRRPSHDDTCRDLYADLELSWILVDNNGQSAANLSSGKPVSVDKHWLTGEVHVRYAIVLDDNRIVTVEVTCVGCGPGGHVLHVTEVCLRMEGLDGVGLDGKGSLVILRQVFGSKRGNCGKGKFKTAAEAKKRYFEFLERRKVSKERKLKREGRLDVMCAVFGVGFIVALFCWSILLALLLKTMSLFVFRSDQMRSRIRFIPS